VELQILSYHEQRRANIAAASVQSLPVRARRSAHA
jgi:hypothetical protein